MPKYRSWSDADLAAMAEDLSEAGIAYRIRGTIIDTSHEDADEIAERNRLTRLKEKKPR